MYSFSKYKKQYAANLRLALPVVVSQLGQIMVQFADNIMVGQWGGDNPLPLAAVSFGSSAAFLFFIAGIGLAMGITPLVGELFGRGDDSRSSSYLFNAIILYTAVGVFTLALQLASIPLLYRMGQPTEVVSQSLAYYRLMAFSMPFVMLFCAFKQFLEGVGNTFIPMAVLLAGNMLNVLFNYVFIYGHWGFDAMGVTGAGLATFLARALTPIFIIVVFFSVNPMRKYVVAMRSSRVSYGDMRRLLHMGFPIAGQMFLESAAFVLTSIMMGWLGTIAIGANQITMTLGNCAFMIVTAIGASTTIRVSHCYGARNLDELSLASKASLHMVMMWNFTAAVLFVVLRGVLPRMFSPNAEIIELASVLLVCMAAYQLSDGIQNVSIGIMRGLQDVKVIPLISFLSYIVLNLPVGYLLGFTLGMGPKGLILAYFVGLSCTAVLCLRRIRRKMRLLRQVGVS